MPEFYDHTCDCGCGAHIEVKPHHAKPSHGVPRYAHGHNRRATGIDYIQESGPLDTPCWIWQRQPTKRYGAIMVNGVRRPAHRVLYERKYGSIPEGLEPDHRCRNTRCVNPDHLEPVTHRENTLRGEGPTALNARRTHCSEGHPLEQMYGQRRCRTCTNRKARERRTRL